MDLIWLALVIQTVFFIVKNAHYAIFIFIILSLILTYFKMNKSISIILPMICAHVAFLYLSPKIEPFYRRKKRKKRRKRRKNRARAKKEEELRAQERRILKRVIKQHKDDMGEHQDNMKEHKKDVEANKNAMEALL